MLSWLGRLGVKMTTSLWSELVVLENDLRKMSDVQTWIGAKNSTFSIKENATTISTEKEEQKIKLAKSTMITKFQSL